MWLCIKQRDGRVFIIREEEVTTISLAPGDEAYAILTTDKSRLMSSEAIEISTHHDIGSAIGSMKAMAGDKCRVCGCTDTDCRQCIEKAGEPCHWVEPHLCSACAGGAGELAAHDAAHTADSGDGQQA